jgi:hypothetical protein
MMQRHLAFGIFLLLLAVSSAASALLPQDANSYYAQYAAMRNNYSKYALDLQSDSCASCIDFSNLAESMVFAVQTSNETAEVIVVYSSKINGLQNRFLSNYTPLIVVANKTDVYRIYTDGTGKALYNFSKYCIPGTSTDYVFVYCPIVTGCGYVQCLQSFGIDAGQCGDFDQLPMGSPGATAPTQKSQPDMGTLQPSVTTATYSTPQQEVAPSAPVFCLPLMLIFALLAGAMYVTGRNPFGMFDLSAPRLQKPFQYTARSRVTSISMSSIGSGIGSLASAAKSTGAKGDQKDGSQQQGKTVMIDGKMVQVGSGMTGLSLGNVTKIQSGISGVKTAFGSNRPALYKDSTTGALRKPTTAAEWTSAAYAQTGRAMLNSLGNALPFLQPLINKESGTSWAYASFQSLLGLIRSTSFGVFFNALDSIAGLFHNVRSKPNDPDSGPKSLFDMLLDAVAQRPTTTQEALERVNSARELKEVNGAAVIGIGEDGKAIVKTLPVSLSKEELPKEVSDAIAKAEKSLAAAAEGKKPVKLELGKAFQPAEEIAGKDGSKGSQFFYYTAGGKTYKVEFSKDDGKATSIAILLAPSTSATGEARIQLNPAALPSWLKDIASGSTKEITNNLLNSSSTQGTFTITDKDNKTHIVDYTVKVSGDGNKTFELLVGSKDGKAYAITFNTSIVGDKLSLDKPKIERLIDTFDPQLASGRVFDANSARAALTSALATVNDAREGRVITAGSTETKDLVLRNVPETQLTTFDNNGKEVKIDNRWIEVTDSSGNKLVLTSKNITITADNQMIIRDPATGKALQLGASSVDVFTQDGKKLTVDISALIPNNANRIAAVDKITGQEVSLTPNRLNVVGTDGKVYNVSTNDLRFDSAGNVSVVDRDSGRVVLTSNDKFEILNSDGSKQVLSARDMKINPDGNLYLVNRATGEQTVFFGEKITVTNQQTGRQFSVSAADITVSSDGRMSVLDPATKQEVPIETKMEVSGLDGRKFSLASVNGNTTLTEIPKEDGKKASQVLLLSFVGEAVKTSDGKEYLLKPAASGSFELVDPKTGENANIKGKEFEINYQGKTLNVVGGEKGSVVSITEGTGKDQKLYSSQLLESAFMSRTDLPPTSPSLATIKSENGLLVVTDPLDGRKLNPELGLEVVTRGASPILISTDKNGDITVKDKTTGANVLMLPQEGVEFYDKSSKTTYLLKPSETGQNNFIIIDPKTGAPPELQAGEKLSISAKIGTQNLVLDLVNSGNSRAVDFKDADGKPIKVIGQGDTLTIKPRDYTFQYDEPSKQLLVIDNASGVRMAYDEKERTFVPLNDKNKPDVSIPAPPVPATVANSYLCEKSRLESATSILDNGITYTDNSGTTKQVTYNPVTNSVSTSDATVQKIGKSVDLDVALAPKEVQDAYKQRLQDFADASYFYAQLKMGELSYAEKMLAEKARDYVNVESKEVQQYARAKLQEAIANGDKDNAIYLAAASFESYKDFRASMKEMISDYNKKGDNSAALLCNHVLDTMSGSHTGVRFDFLAKAYPDTYMYYDDVRKNAGSVIWNYYNPKEDYNSGILTPKIEKALGGRDNLMEHWNQNRVLNTEREAAQIMMLNHDNYQRTFDASPTLTHESLDTLRRITANNWSANAAILTGDGVRNALSSFGFSLPSHDAVQLNDILGEAKNHLNFEYNMAHVSTEILADNKNAPLVREVTLNELEKLENQANRLERQADNNQMRELRDHIYHYTAAISSALGSSRDEKTDEKIRTAVYDSLQRNSALPDISAQEVSPGEASRAAQNARVVRFSAEAKGFEAMAVGARAIDHSRTDNDSDYRALGEHTYETGYYLIHSQKMTKSIARPETWTVDTKDVDQSRSELENYSDQKQQKRQDTYFSSMWASSPSPIEQPVTPKSGRTEREVEAMRSERRAKEEEEVRVSMDNAKTQAELNKIMEEKKKRTKSQAS